MKRVGSIIEGMCHGVHQVLSNLSESIQKTEADSTSCRPSLHASPRRMREVGSPITGTRPKVRTSDTARAVMKQKEVMAIPARTEKQPEQKRDASGVTSTTPVGNENKGSTRNLDSWLNEWKNLTRMREYNEGTAILFFLELIPGSKLKELKSRVRRELQSIEDLLTMITGLELLQRKEEDLRLFLEKNMEKERCRGCDKGDPLLSRGDGMGAEVGEETPEGMTTAGVWEECLHRREMTRCTSQLTGMPRMGERKSSTTSKRHRRPHQLSPSAIYEGLMILMVRMGTELRGMIREACQETPLRAAVADPQQDESQYDSSTRE